MSSQLATNREDLHMAIHVAPSDPNDPYVWKPMPEHVDRIAADTPAPEGIPLEMTGSHERGYNITGWVDGRTEAVITWQGWDDQTPGDVETYRTTVNTIQDALTHLGSIEMYINLRLVSAVLVVR
jgi:hypothetical protein